MPLSRFLYLCMYFSLFSLVRLLIFFISTLLLDLNKATSLSKFSLFNILEILSSTLVFLLLLDCFILCIDVVVLDYVSTFDGYCTFLYVYLYVCVHMCVHMYVCVCADRCAGTCVCMWKAEVNLRCHQSVFTFEIGFLSEPRAHPLASSRNPRVGASPLVSGIYC